MPDLLNYEDSRESKKFDFFSADDAGAEKSKEYSKLSQSDRGNIVAKKAKKVPKLVSDVQVSSTLLGQRDYTFLVFGGANVGKATFIETLTGQVAKVQGDGGRQISNDLFTRKFVLKTGSVNIKLLR